MVEPTGVKRKLAVILAADVEGYSRLMGADERGDQLERLLPKATAGVSKAARRYAAAVLGAGR